jgi:hypothetical protein
MKTLTKADQAKILRLCGQDRLIDAVAVLCHRIGFVAGSTVLRAVAVTSRFAGEPYFSDWVSVGYVTREALRRAGGAIGPAARQALVDRLHTMGPDEGHLAHGYTMAWNAGEETGLDTLLRDFDAL